MRVVHHPWQGRSPERSSGVALSSSVSVFRVELVLCPPELIIKRLPKILLRAVCNGACL